MKKVKFRKSLATNIVCIFLIFNLLSIFLFTYYVTRKEEDKSLEYAKSSLQEIVNEKSDLITITFDRIETQVQLLGAWTEKLLEKGGYSRELSDQYVIEEDGTIYRKKIEGREESAESNIMVSASEEKNGELFYQINLTEELDDIFDLIIQNEDVTWVYIVTRNNLLRVSPYRNLHKDFDSEHSQIEDIFYVLADEENNPEKKAVWTPPYTDYLGNGWTITCTQPVYESNGEMFGVVCLDLAIENIKEKYFEGFSLGKSGKVYWINSSGNIFYHTDYSQETADQGEVYERNIFHEKNMSEEKKQALKQAMQEEQGSRVFSESDGEKIMVYSKVTGNDSTLIIEMDMKEFSATRYLDMEKAAMFFLIDILLAGLFGLVLYYKFTKPMRKLVHGANRISGGDYSFIKEEYAGRDENYYEISQLNQAFRAMNDSIETYTKTLLHKNREISTILETIEGALMIVDMDGNICIQSKEAAGVSDENIDRAVAKFREEKAGFSEQVLRDGEIYKNDYYPIFEENGDVEKFVISSQCITRSILLEKEMQQIEKMAGVGQLSAAIVHELKNVLTRIKGAAYILKLLEGDGEGSKEITTIMRAVEEAENTITTLLDFSRREPDGSEMIHIGTLIQQILLLSKKEIIGKNISVDLDLDNRCYIYSSGREAIKVILQNLISNSIQAAGCDGKISIYCGRQGEEAVVRICDNGQGIQVEPVERIFEPFMTTKKEGTGIGLWITKRLVDSLDGTIDVSRTEEEETEFIVRIPMRNRSEDNHEETTDSSRG